MLPIKSYEPEKICLICEKGGNFMLGLLTWEDLSMESFVGERNFSYEGELDFPALIKNYHIKQFVVTSCS